MDILKDKDLSFSEEKSIQVMKSAIATSKRAMMNDGLLLILWGAGLSISNFYNYYKTANLMAWRMQNFLDILQILMGITIIGITFYFIFRKNKVTTFATITTRYIWIGVILAHNVIVIITKVVLTEIDFELIHPLQMVLIGFALFISGGAYRYYPLVIGGIVFWAAALLGAKFDMSNQYLIRSIAEVICFIIPGLMMYSAKGKIN